MKSVNDSMREPLIIRGDCHEVLKGLDENSVDSIVTDPPYELGFMGKSWDSTGIANNVEMWKECLRVLKPGGHLLAFSGTRTYHRMASAIEDAGFEVRDMIEWVYSTGFPKSLNVGKAVDKLQGNERELVRERSYEMTDGGGYSGNLNTSKPRSESCEITKGTSKWEGWGTALKPAHEPICMARKPLSEKSVAENCLRWKTGGINIDISRVVAYNGLNENTRIPKEKGAGESGVFEVSNLQKRNPGMEELSGEVKEPANLREGLQGEINNGGQGLDLEGWKDQETRRVYFNQQDEQTGTSGSDRETLEKETSTKRGSSPQEWEERRQQNRELGSDKSGSPHNEIPQQERQENGQTNIGRWPSNLIHDNSEEVRECFPESSVTGKRTLNSQSKDKKQGDSQVGWHEYRSENEYTDSGNASRFFKSIIYQAKASKSERNRGCDELPLGEPPASARSKPAEGRQNALGEPRANNHPTVKPVALMEYLIKMVTPKGGIVLDPFMGSGTTGVAAKQNGYGFIGIEMEKDYCEIAQKRMDEVRVEDKLF